MHVSVEISVKLVVCALEQHPPSQPLFQWLEEVKRLMQFHDSSFFEGGDWVVSLIQGRNIHNAVILGCIHENLIGSLECCSSFGIIFRSGSSESKYLVAGMTCTK